MNGMNKRRRFAALSGDTVTASWLKKLADWAHNFFDEVTESLARAWRELKVMRAAFFVDTMPPASISYFGSIFMGARRPR